MDKKKEGSLVSSGDIVEITGKTILSAIPIGGTLISETWSSVKSNAAQKRLIEWQNMVEARLCKLEISLDDIGNNERFTSAIFHATEAAIKTAETEKREYLANAVLNSIDCDFDESVMMLLINMIDRYTLLHIKILDFFQNPKKYKNKYRQNYYMGSPKDLLYEVYPTLKNMNDIVDIVCRELYTDGLLNTSSFGATMTFGGMEASRTTELGSRFIEFITQ